MNSEMKNDEIYYIFDENEKLFCKRIVENGEIFLLTKNSKISLSELNVKAKEKSNSFVCKRRLNRLNIK